jgi:hypothetical protein
MTPTMTVEQAHAINMYTKGLEYALRAYYNQHQATGCKCELCKTALMALAFSPEKMEAEKQKPDK